MTTDSWSDYRQARRIRQLDTELESLISSLSRQRADSTRLRSQLAQLQGTLEERINRMSRAFDAFVELSDIRTVLALFDAPALVRHRSRQLLANIAEPTDVPATRFLPREADVSDYWLSPAVRGLSTLLDNGDADADADIAAAQQLDPVKTATLIAATAALADRLDIATSWLGNALGDLHPGVPITVAQRLLWREAAAGAFGSGGLQMLEDRLHSCVAQMDAVKLTAIDDGLRSMLRTNASGGIALFDGDPNVLAATIAARQLATLRELCETTTTSEDTTVEPVSAEATTPVPGSSSRLGGSVRPDGNGKPAGVGKAALGALVRQIVDEGTDEERPMLRRAEELKAIIENRPAPAQPEEWDALIETPEALLAADAGGATGHNATGGGAAGGSATAAGSLARRVLAPRLIAIADGLASTATVDAPDAITLSQRSGNIRITMSGPNAGDLSSAQRKVEAEYPPIVVLDPPTWILAAVGVVLAVVSFFLPVGWLVLLLIVGAGALVWAGARYIQRTRMQTEQTNLRQRAAADVERRAGQSHQNYLAAVNVLQ